MRIIMVVLALGFGSLLATPAAAQENRAAFEKRVKRYATNDLTSPHGLCWCKDGIAGPGTGEAGYVMYQSNGAVIVSCQLPFFNNDGSFSTFVACAVEWEMLGRWQLTALRREHAFTPVLVSQRE